MKIRDNTIEWRSHAKFYVKERNGIKPNTVRLTDRTYEISAWWDRPGPKIIRIKLEGSAQGFERVLTDISEAGEVLGKTLIIFSWAHVPD